MDSHQWRDQQQPPNSALTLFACEPGSNANTTLQSPAPAAVPRVGGYFSLAQWQELELQALIYKHMIAGVSVPMELILPIKRSILTASQYYHHQSQLFQHYQPSLIQTGYWGRSAIDPEPGRCRRTDGKKWRCSREVVAGQKYCERHVHRGRNRSRKHVEIPTHTAGGVKSTLSSPLPPVMNKESYATHAGSSPPLNIPPLNQRSPNGKTADHIIPESKGKTGSHVLRRFFDDWPRTQEEEHNTSNSMSSPSTSTTQLSISIPTNPSSDFSLKLSTGNAELHGLGSGCSKDTKDERLQPSNWCGWVHHGEASMGGPLAEALRSSTSTPSPASVLQKLNGSVSETSSIST
ncbi:growth-regulating factor 3-like isoform X1 [Typha latifolia]|uniref:growth-regulating factor 3-like isoform X1 n=1 Tax=Typha latifolia TaxID=4733 RepID=UPI003C2C564C